jgi:DNA (cytosine-5)-methyltransferase 1
MPAVGDGVRGDCPSERRRNSPSLVSVVVRERVPTPTVTGNHNRKGASPTSGDGLATYIRERVPTPTAQDAANNGGPSQSERNTPPLNAIVGGLLNPDWVEWLMGWPVGWTDTTREDAETHDWSAEPCPRVTTRRDLRPARLKQIGNGQVPQCAAMAWRILNQD